MDNSNIFYIIAAIFFLGLVIYTIYNYTKPSMIPRQNISEGQNTMFQTGLLVVRNPADPMIAADSVYSYIRNNVGTYHLDGAGQSPILLRQSCPCAYNVHLATCGQSF